MASPRKDAACGAKVEYAKHLRKFGKKKFWGKSRKSAKKMMGVAD